MKKPGRKLQKRTMGLLRNLMILGVSFVGLTVVLQLEIEYNLLVLIYALSAVAVLLYQLIRNRSDRDKLDQEVARSNFLMNAALPGFCFLQAHQIRLNTGYSLSQVCPLPSYPDKSICAPSHNPSPHKACRFP